MNSYLAAVVIVFVVIAAVVGIYMICQERGKSHYRKRSRDEKVYFQPADNKKTVVIVRKKKK